MTLLKLFGHCLLFRLCLIKGLKSEDFNFYHTAEVQIAGLKLNGHKEKSLGSTFIYFFIWFVYVLILFNFLFKKEKSLHIDLETYLVGMEV